MPLRPQFLACALLAITVAPGCRKPPAIEPIELETTRDSPPVVGPAEPGGRPQPPVVPPRPSVAPGLDPAEGMKQAQAAFDANDDKKGIEFLDRAIATIEHDGKVRLEEEVSPFYWARGHAKHRIKQDRSALVDFKKALALEPNNARYLNQTAWLLATSPDDKARDGPVAVEYAQRAVRQTKEDPDANPFALVQFLDTLAAAYAEAREFKHALRAQQEAIEIWQGAPVELLAFARFGAQWEAMLAGKQLTEAELKVVDREIEKEKDRWTKLLPEMRARRELYTNSKPHREK